MTSLPKRSLRLVSLAMAVGLLASACVGPQTFLPLTTDNPVASLSEGLTVSVNPALMPSDFGVQLSAVPAETFMQGQAGKEWAAARDTLPASLQLKSGLFQIHTHGTLPAASGAPDDTSAERRRSLLVP